MNDTTISESLPRARKRYICDWCGEPIVSGEQYSKWVGTFDGDFQTSRLHLECHSALLRDDDYLADVGFEPWSQRRGMTMAESVAAPSTEGERA